MDSTHFHHVQHSFTLWGQVLIAARLTRRGVLALIAEAEQSPRFRLLATCDAIELCVIRGSSTQAERMAMQRALAWQPTVFQHQIALAIQGAVEATFSAEASLDVGAAEPSCERAVSRSVLAIMDERRVDAELAWRVVDADLIAIRDVCTRLKLCRYDPIPSTELERLATPEPLSLKLL